ncbi:MAG: CotH kinase family protein [Ruminococcus sp.]|nr:CotH kinase family protein [Ruminococcus sp.]
MQTKKITAAILAAITAITMFGCSSSDSSSDGSQANQADNSSAASESKDSSSNDDNSSTGGDRFEVKPVKYSSSAPVAEFSAESGFYDKEFELELTAPDPSLKVYYTLDGSDPDMESEVYSGPIKIVNRSTEPDLLAAQPGQSAGGDFFPYFSVKKGTVIKAAAFSEDGTRGDIVCKTYFVGINREKHYSDAPIISIVTDFDNLYDYETGIYTLGKAHDDWLAEDKKNKNLDGWQHVGNYSQRGKEWERRVSVELIEADGDIGFSQDMGMRIMGAASRNEMQKSLRLIAREEYGAKNVKYDLIPNNERSDGNGEVEKYKSFVLRNGGNDCNFAKIRDPLLQSLVSDRDFETQQFSYCVAFINGEYWGMYTITEDYRDNYFANNYEIDKDNVVLIKRGEIEEGNEEDISLFTDMRDYILDNDMSVAANYEKASEMLDMQSFAEYCAFNIYIGNDDSFFNNNNWRMWRVRTPDSTVTEADGRWRMVAYDTDYSTGIYQGGDGYRSSDLSKYIVGKGLKYEPEDEPHPGLLLGALYKNDEFRALFINTLMDMRNISFEKDRVSAQIKEISVPYLALMPATYKRFGPAYIQDGGFLENQINMLKSYLKNRYSNFGKIVMSAVGSEDMYTVKISASDGALTLNKYELEAGTELDCQYLKEYPITVTAHAPEGKKFVRWEAEGVTVSDTASESITVNVTADGSITPIYE